MLFQANPDVNIIMGINGSGKTTFLSNLYKSLLGSKDTKDNVVYLPSIDNISMRDKRKTATALSQDLEYFIYDMKTGPSLMSLRMSMIDSTAERQAELRGRIETFQQTVNELFALTEKRIEIEGNKFSVISQNGVLPVGSLSSGEMQVLLFFVVPVKMKWMALVYVVLAGYDFINGGIGIRVAIGASLLNFVIFFLSTRNYKRFGPREQARKAKFKKQSSPHMTYTNGAHHRCAVCGRTELDDPCLEFRFCSKCNGNYEYCQDHLFTHEHVK